MYASRVNCVCASCAKNIEIMMSTLSPGKIDGDDGRVNGLSVNDSNFIHQSIMTVVACVVVALLAQSLQKDSTSTCRTN